MNIKILDSWLREQLQTSSSPQEIAKNLSLTSVSIERIEPYKNDWVYDIEITTNRPDLASVNGLAREAGAVLPQQGIKAEYKPLLKNNTENKMQETKKDSHEVLLRIQNDTLLVNRICAVVMEVEMGKSPDYIQDRLEASDIRSLNNIVDVTNYVMRAIGQPTHVMDYDRVGESLTIREAKKGERITTLDHKTYTLFGGDIVAENDKGEIIDLLGVMGLEKSVVTDKTKRILFFINNVNAYRVRKTSMEQGIRTEAVQLNEKHLDPELCSQALQYGIQLYQKLAQGNVISKSIDIYPQKTQAKQVIVNQTKIDKTIGIAITPKQVIDILIRLGFSVSHKGEQFAVTVPSFRSHDITLPEDLVEEVARVYGYHNLPSELPLLQTQTPRPMTTPFYWEELTKQTLKNWGFTEVYTYSMVSENLYEGPLEKAVTIANPLNEDMVYMRKSLVPSLLQIAEENKQDENLHIFEIANVYHKKEKGLPDEIQTVAGVVRQAHVSFFAVKGFVQQLFQVLGIHAYSFTPSSQGGDGTNVYIEKNLVGDIEILDNQTIDFELDFSLICQFANIRKTYSPPSKYPPILEDISIKVPSDILTEDIIAEISQQSRLIRSVTLLDRYEDNRTFHIMYQDKTKNLTTENVKEIHEKILTHLKKYCKAKEV